MVKIVVIVKPDCLACEIVKKVIVEAINNVESNITLSILNAEDYINYKYAIKVYPTTIISKKRFIEGNINGINYKTRDFVEIARLEGSFSIDYLNKVIDKLKLECNE